MTTFNYICLDDIEMSIWYERTVVPDIRAEDYGSGTIALDQSLIMTEIKSVMIELFDEEVDILRTLTEKQKKRIVRLINEQA